MEWTELTVFTSAEGIDDVCAMMTSNGAEGVVIEDENDFLDFLDENRSKWDYVDDDLLKQKHCETNVKTYLPANADGFAVYKAIEQAADEMKKNDISGRYGRLYVTTNNRDDSEWKDKWKEYFKPFNVGKLLRVCPAWIEDKGEDGRKEIILETGQLFGTGLHATTRLCLEAIEKYITDGCSMLDLGTGSGILAVAGAALGAGTVRAIDIDEGVKKTLPENIRLNGLSEKNFEIIAGDVLSDKKIAVGKNSKYKVITANIVADVIIALSEFIAEYLEKDGTAIFSGIIKERADEVKTAIENGGMKIISSSADNGWTEFEAKLK